MHPEQLKKTVTRILTAGLCPFITGSPGIGKSDIIKTVADTFNLFIIDLRLSQCDPTDMLGFPIHDGKRMGYAPPEHFPLEGDPLPVKPDGSKYAGWLLFLDEFSSASQAVQAAAYKTVLDRQVGKYNLHKNCAIVCAGNKETDGAIVNRLSTAMQSRLVHIELEVSAKDWIAWAQINNIDHRAVSFIEGRPDCLHKFDPNHNDKTFACPRTWEFASKLIYGDDVTPDMLDMLIGTVSAGIAHEFNAYLTYCGELPSMDDIKARPDDIEIPDDPALLYALSYMVAAFIEEATADRLMRYIKRLPLEFGTTCIRAALKRDKELLKVDAVRTWAHQIAAEIF